MHEKSDHPDFMKTVMEIKSAEDQYSRTIAKANEESDRIQRLAKEEALESRRKNEEELVAFKNARLREGAEDIETETSDLLKKAKAEAGKTMKKGLEGKDAETIARKFLSSI